MTGIVHFIGAWALVVFTVLALLLTLVGLLCKYRPAGTLLRRFVPSDRALDFLDRVVAVSAVAIAVAYGWALIVGV